MEDDFEFERSEAWAKRLSRIWLGALWGFAEATLFFLVPDILLTAAALFSPKRSFVQMLAVLIGALLGGALMYTAADKFPDESQSMLLAVPFIKVRLLDKAEGQMQDHGLWAMCLGALSGIPYKVYAVASPRYGPFEKFMAISVPARLGRLFFSWSIASLLGVLFRRQIDESPPAALGLLIICWIGFYTYYWSVI
jgi:membrane protein YqaA with SNARE-associated domain